MRTTLTIDDDVAARLRRLGAGRRFKEVTNRALRLGLQAMEQAAEEPPYHTTPVTGRPRLANLDNIAEVLAEAEGEGWR